MKQKDMKNTEVEQENVETVTEEQKEQVQTIYIVEKTKYVQPIQPNSHGDLIIKKEDSVRVSCPKCGLRMKIKYDNKAYQCPNCFVLLRPAKRSVMKADVEAFKLKKGVEVAEVVATSGTENEKK